MACKKCGKCCCGKMGPIIIPNDIKPLCNKLGISYRQFLNGYCEKYIIHTCLKQIHIYYLKMCNNKCIFLNDKHLCTVYNTRPFQCVHAPLEFMAHYKYWTHMSCITAEDFVDRNSEKVDLYIFSSILNEGYAKYEEVI